MFPQEKNRNINLPKRILKANTFDFNIRRMYTYDKQNISRTEEDAMVDKENVIKGNLLERSLVSKVEKYSKGCDK